MYFSGDTADIQGAHHDQTSIIRLAFSLAIILLAALVTHAQEGIQIYSLEADRPVSRDTFAKSLVDQRIVPVGERHNQAGHHRGQLEVIKLLVAEGVPVTPSA